MKNLILKSLVVWTFHRGGGGNTASRAINLNPSVWTLSRAFTMAEILLSLTIIGVVAAITLPALTGNINERVWNTQHKALYARLSQALPLIPSLNGYGRVERLKPSNKILDTRAETFITSALSKVIKINNICDYKHFQDCGLPEKFTNMTGSKKDWPLSWYNIANSSGQDREPYAAAFETPNGESIAVYYNQTCRADKVLSWHNNGDYDTYPNICAVFMYDLNGKKGPNTVGKDIGIITAFYPIDPVVVAPRLIKPPTDDSVTSKEAAALCKKQDPQSRISTLEEAMAIGYYDTGLLGFSKAFYWSKTKDKSNKAYADKTDKSSFGYWIVGGNYYFLDSELSLMHRKYWVLCVKR